MTYRSARPFEVTEVERKKRKKRNKRGQKCTVGKAFADKRDAKPLGT
jgi:hypothetical protein